MSSLENDTSKLEQKADGQSGKSSLKSEEKKDRLSKALRDNLRRRKDQVRARKAPKVSEQDPEGK